MSKSLKTMMEEIRKLNNKNGWFMNTDIFKIEDSVPQELLFMQLELTNVLEAYRKNKYQEYTKALNALELNMKEHVFRIQKSYIIERTTKTVAESLFLITSEISEAFEAIAKGDKKNLGEETADIFIRLLDICEHADIDLEAEYEKKMEKNWKRDYRHGNKRA